MARIRSVSPEVLNARRLGGADLLAVRAMLTMVYPSEQRGGHWDACELDPTLCHFDVGVFIGGSCSTCSHIYEAVKVTLSCACGTRTSEREIDSVDLPTLLTRMHEIAVADGLNTAMADAAGDELLDRFAGLDDERAEVREQLDAYYEFDDPDDD